MSRNPVFENMMELIRDGLYGDNVMLWIETEDYQYEVNDVKVECSIDQNGRILKVVTIKVSK